MIQIVDELVKRKVRFIGDQGSDPLRGEAGPSDQGDDRPVRAVRRGREGPDLGTDEGGAGGRPCQGPLARPPEGLAGHVEARRQGGGDPDAAGEGGLPVAAGHKTSLRGSDSNGEKKQRTWLEAPGSLRRAFSKLISARLIREGRYESGFRESEARGIARFRRKAFGLLETLRLRKPGGRQITHPFSLPVEVEPPRQRRQPPGPHR